MDIKEKINLISRLTEEVIEKDELEFVFSKYSLKALYWLGNFRKNSSWHWFGLHAKSERFCRCRS